MGVSTIIAKSKEPGTIKPQEPLLLIYTCTFQLASHRQSTGADTSCLPTAPIPELAPFGFSTANVNSFRTAYISLPTT